MGVTGPRLEATRIHRALRVRAIGILGALLVAALLSFLGPAPNAASSGGPAAPAFPSASGFVENAGQFAPGVRFVARGPGSALALRSASADLLLRSAERETVRVRMTFPGASGAPAVVGEDPLAARSHDYVGNDPSGWVRGAVHPASVRYEDLYPGIDLVFRRDGSGGLEYDFVAAPGSDPRGIRLAFEGSGEDAGAGVEETLLAIHGGAFSRGTGVLLEGDGVHALRFFSRDAVGREEVPLEIGVAIDATSGVATSQLALDDGALREGSVFEVAGDGVHALRCRSIDRAGNTEAVREREIRIDTAAPVTSASLSGLAGDSGWWRSSVRVALAATDATSGVSGTYASVNGGPSGRATGITLEGDGVHAVRYRSVDAAGNAEAPHTLTVAIDGTAPSLALLEPRDRTLHANLTGTPRTWPLPNGTRALVVGNLDVRADASDATSGIDRVEFRVDGAKRRVSMGDPHRFLWEAGSESAGDHALLATACDRAGNPTELRLDVRTLPGDERGLAATGNGLLLAVLALLEKHREGASPPEAPRETPAPDAAG